MKYDNVHADPRKEFVRSDHHEVNEFACRLLQWSLGLAR